MRVLARVTAATLIVVLAITSPLLAGGGSMGKIIRIVDGSTIEVDLRGEPTKVALHGIATPDPTDTRPELKQLGQEATAYLSEYLKDGWVYLEFLSNPPAPDANGIVPAFVYRGSDAKFVNKEIVLRGMGVVNRKLESAFRDELLVTENKARAANAGLWGSFADGGGQASAAGKSHQATYIGEAADRRGTSNVVYFWIIRFR